MTIQRNSDNEDDDNESIGDLPIILPKYSISEQKLKHLEKARARKAELAILKKEERDKNKEDSFLLSKGVKQIKDPVSKEIIKNEILKATNLRKPKKQIVENPIQLQPKPKKQPQIVVEESEPEVIFVKRPKKKIVIEESATETETEPEIKPKRRFRRKPVVSESESDYDLPPQKPIKQPLKQPIIYNNDNNINRHNFKVCF
jgi:translation initiation factor IF-2